MLRELRIRNLAIIDDLKVRFDKGFNVLTGETGAGKSIIVDSLGLALGNKVQPDFMRSGEKEAVVQAFFEIEGVTHLPDLGVDITEGLILRRAIFASGKSRAYINDTMVSTQSLAEVGRSLVEIHGQHEHQNLLSVERHRTFLDMFGKLQGEQARVEMLYREVESLKRGIAVLQKTIQERLHKIDLLKFQMHEIDSANLKAGEIEHLNEQKAILSNLGKLKELSDSAYEELYNADDACISKLSAIVRKLQEMATIDQQVAGAVSVIESALPLLEDAAISLRGCKSKYEFEPGSLDAVEERLGMIRKLEKKYGEGIESILRHRDNAEVEMKSLEAAESQTASLEKELITKEAALSEAVAALSVKRQNAALRMEKLVVKELEELAFGDAQFRIDVGREELSPHGIDRIEFLFSANAGESPKPLARIASGGELSRVMLALKTVFADMDRIPVLIFDEIDSGIGGKTAEIVGKKLRELSDKHQVLCTTHLPQLASKASVHLKIEKKQKNKRACVEVKELARSERMNEIARMLSGNITDISLRHARELIENAA